MCSYPPGIRERRLDHAVVVCGQEHLRLRALVEGLGQLLLDVPPHRGRQGSRRHCAAVAIAGGAVRVGTVPVDRVTDTTIVVVVRIAVAVARAFGHGTTARTMSTATVVRALAMRLGGQRIGVRIAVLVACPEVLVLFVAVVEVVVIVGMFVVAAAVHGLSVTVTTVSVRVAATQVAFAAVVRVLMLMVVVGG